MVAPMSTKTVRWTLALLALFAIGVLLAGCGGRGETTTVTVTQGTPESSAPVSDPAVVDLQTMMSQLGYYSGPIDGIYGPATTEGVKAMQKALGVPVDGIYGPATDAALNGKGKDTVIQLQSTLASYGYYTGPIDGVYGTATTDAVKALQSDLGITVDGQVGQETLAAFNQAVADGELQPVGSSTTTTTTTTTTTSATTTAATT
jgi:peptidoglycan hydrolase-like protein with peptidoglycan-binding domain